MLENAKMRQEGMGNHALITGVSYMEGLDYQKECRTFNGIPD